MNLLFLIISMSGCQTESPSPVSMPSITTPNGNELAFSAWWISEEPAITTLHAVCDKGMVVELTETVARTDHYASVIGLHEREKCEIWVTLNEGGQEVFQSESRAFQAGQLPDWLPEVTLVNRQDSASASPTLLTLGRDGEGSPGALMVVDSDGEVRWTHEVWSAPPPQGFNVTTVDLPSTGADLAPLESGIGILVGGFGPDNPPRLLSPDGRELWGSDIDMHHELDSLGGDEWLALSYDNCSGVESGKILRFRGEDADPLWTWSSCDHLYSGQKYNDWDHLNSFHLVDDDTLVVTARNLNTVFAVDLQTGEMLWRLGDGGDVAMPNGESIIAPHAVEVLGNGNVLLFDNGDDSRPTSRALELRVDPSAGSAEIVWQYELDVYAPLLGDANRLPSGSTQIVVGMIDGSDSLLMEVSETGQTLSLLSVGDGWALNRAVQVPDFFGGRVLDEASRLDFGF